MQCESRRESTRSSVVNSLRFLNSILGTYKYFDDRTVVEGGVIKFFCEGLYDNNIPNVKTYNSPRTSYVYTGRHIFLYNDIISNHFILIHLGRTNDKINIITTQFFFRRVLLLRATRSFNIDFWSKTEQYSGKA